MTLPELSYENPELMSTDYRYGFNGKEVDNDGEWGGDVNHYDYGFRIYNPGIAKFLSVDPLTRSYPMLTPYQFASNSPISNVDYDGLEKFYAASGEYINTYGASTEFRVVKESEVDRLKVNFANQYVVPPDVFHNTGEKAFTSSDQAALDFAFKNNGKTHITDLEHGAKIFKREMNDGNNLFVLGKTVVGKNDEFGSYVDLIWSFSPFESWEEDSGVHTHPPNDKNSENFSPLGHYTKGTYGDGNVAITFPNGLYLSTPKGLLKHLNPDQEEREVYFGVPKFSPYGIKAEFISKENLPSYESDRLNLPTKVIEYETPELNEEGG